MRAAYLLPALSLTAAVVSAAPAAPHQEHALDKRTYGLWCWFGWCDDNSSSYGNAAASSSSVASVASVSSVSIRSAASAASVLSTASVASVASVAQASMASVSQASVASVAKKTSSAAAPAATSSALVSSGYNWQRWGNALNGKGCSPVYTYKANLFACEAQVFEDLLAALTYSCKSQQLLCYTTATWSWWSWWGVSYSDCDKQRDSCVAQANNDCNSRTASIASVSKASIVSVASAKSAGANAAASIASVASVIKVSTASVASVSTLSRASVAAAASNAAAASSAAEASRASVSAASLSSIAAGNAAAASSIASVASVASLSSISAQASLSRASVAAAASNSAIAQSYKSVASVNSVASVASASSVSAAGAASASSISAAAAAAASASSISAAAAAAASASSISAAAAAAASASSVSAAAAAAASVSSVSAAAAAASKTSSSSAAPATATGIVSGTIPAGWTLASGALVVDLVQNGQRILTGSTGESATMTPAFCVNECAGRGFALAALENTSECFCGNALVNGGSLSLTTSTPALPCKGDATLTCGGWGGVQLYRNTAVLDSTLQVIASAPAASSSSAAAPSSSAAAASSSSSAAAPTTTTTAAAAPSTSAIATDNGFTSTGACIAEIDGRLLTGASFVSDSMTYSLCTTFCANAGFTVAGVEYGDECYCGTQDAIASVSPSTQCNSPCAGDSSKICGGGQALILFTTSSTDKTSQTLANGWTATGQCLAEAPGRLLALASTASSSMTQEKCTDYCADQGLDVAGLEYGSECYCGTKAAIANAATSSNCNMACSGDSTELCGGGNALWVFTK